MKKLIAKRSVLYLGRMYDAGDTLPANDQKMVTAWLNAKSAEWDGQEAEECRQEAQEGAKQADGSQGSQEQNEGQEDEENGQEEMVEGHLDAEQLATMKKADLEKLADLCARFPGQVRPFDVDLSDRAKVDTFVQVLAASAPAPTHFIHLPALPVVNAKFKAFDQTRFDRDLEIQVHSAVRICRAVLPAMAKARFGRVLFIQTSYTIGCPPKNTAAYVMAKSAIGGLVKSLAVEYARFGVTVNCVAPSMMETNFLKDTPDLIVQAAAEENPMGRNATPADVVPAMAFLLSDEAGFITGVTLPVTGGSAIV